MIRVVFEADQKTATMKVSGHAKSAEAGHDLICAAVSSLVITLAQNARFLEARKMLKETPEVDLREGDAEISCTAKTKESFRDVIYTYHVIQQGMMVLAHNYPQYIAVKAFGETETS